MDRNRNRVTAWTREQVAGIKRRAREGAEGFCRIALRKEEGIDGILVTVGLCIIALLLCVVMKDSLQIFIRTIVEAMTDKANAILTGPVT